MAWQTEAVEILRALIDDMDDDNPTFDDDRLERLLMVAAFQVNNTFTFENDYTVDISEQSISPDPTEPTTREPAFVNLMCLKAACIIERGKAMTATDKAIAGKEFYSSVDLRGVAAAKKALLDKGGYCVAYNEESDAFLVDGMSQLGAAIMSPFRTLAGYPEYPIRNY